MFTEPSVGAGSLANDGAAVNHSTLTPLTK